MRGKVELHVDGDTAEKYTMGRLSATRVKQVEEHLLICGRCRRVVSATDVYTAAMRQAAAKFRQAERKPKRKTTRKVGANG